MLRTRRCRDTGHFLDKRADVPTLPRPHASVAEDSGQPTAESESPAKKPQGEALPTVTIRGHPSPLQTAWSSDTQQLCWDA